MLGKTIADIVASLALFLGDFWLCGEPMAHNMKDTCISLTGDIYMNKLNTISTINGINDQNCWS